MFIFFILYGKRCKYPSLACHQTVWSCLNSEYICSIKDLLFLAHTLLCWCGSLKCLTNPHNRQVKSHHSAVKSRAHLHGVFHPFPSPHPEEWCRGAICKNDNRPSVTVSPGSSLSTDFHWFHTHYCFPRSCLAPWHVSRINITLVSLLQKTARDHPRHLPSGTSWGRANPDREVVAEGGVGVKARATGSDLFSQMHFYVAYQLFIERNDISYFKACMIIAGMENMKRRKGGKKNKKKRRGRRIKRRKTKRRMRKSKLHHQRR